MQKLLSMYISNLSGKQLSAKSSFPHKKAPQKTIPTYATDVGTQCILNVYPWRCHNERVTQAECINNQYALHTLCV